MQYATIVYILFINTVVHFKAELQLAYTHVLQMQIKWPDKH